MSVQLLDKTRKINKLLHNNNSHKVVFNDICLVLGDILESNILVISKKGKVLGVKNRTDIPPISELIKDSVGGYIDSMLNERLLNILSTKENVNLATLGFDIENVIVHTPFQPIGIYRLPNSILFQRENLANECPPKNCLPQKSSRRPCS